MRLRTKYTAAILSLVLALSGLLGGTLFYQFHNTMDEIIDSGARSLDRQLMDQLEERARLFSGFLSKDLINPLYFLDIESIYYILKTARDQKDVHSIHVFDASGKVIHDGTRLNPSLNEKENEAVIQRVLTEQKPFSMVFNGIYEVAVPIVLQDKLLGGLRVDFSLKEMRESVQRINGELANLEKEKTEEILKEFSWTVLIFSLIAGTLVFLVAGGLSRPIKQLSESALQIGKGDYSARISSNRTDEIGDLAESFQKMANDLQRTTVSKAFVDSILRSMRSALLVVSPKGKVERTNQATLDLLGYPEHELIGESAELILGGRTVFAEALARSVSGEVFFHNTEQTLYGKDGKEVPVLLSGSVIRGENNRVEAMVFVAQDISRLKQAEVQLIRHSRELERSNRDLQDFAFVASHDLQEPLRKVILFNDRLRKDYQDKLDQKAKSYLERMEAAVLQMRNFIDDLLQYSRINSKVSPFESVDLDRVLKNVLNVFELKIKSLNADVRADRLPIIEGDPTQMHQLFQNLISNALKFHREGANPKIRITCDLMDDGYYEIRVEDNGIGFSEKHTARIFKPFERLHGRSEFEGTGMGLAICRKIVERHGGFLSAKPLRSNGAIFIIHIPERQNIIERQTGRMV